LQKADGFTKPLERLKLYGMLEQLGISQRLYALLT
jgi:hypothetical protein